MNLTSKEAWERETKMLAAAVAFRQNRVCSRSQRFCWKTDPKLSKLTAMIRPRINLSTSQVQTEIKLRISFWMNSITVWSQVARALWCRKMPTTLMMKRDPWSFPILRMFNMEKILRLDVNWLSLLERRKCLLWVIAPDASTTSSESEISDAWFGTSGDTVNLKSQYEACS